MNQKIRDYSNIIVAGILVFGLFVFCLVRPPKEMSASERRPLHQLPKLSMSTVFVAKGQTGFTDNFEKYAIDQFPLREEFRKLYSGISLYVLQKKEVNDLYYKDGYIVKLEPSVHEESVEWSLDRMRYINDRYLQNSNVYFAIIPEKNYYMEDAIAYMDFDGFEKRFQSATSDYATYVDVKSTLGLDDYYKTDTHWKQERLYDVAEEISLAMANQYDFNFVTKEYSDDFKGVYYGQGALPVETDSLQYLTGDYLDDLIVKCYDTGVAQDAMLYDWEKANGMDPYELFLSGSKALMTIENPNATSDKELVLFRDSFGSSIAPLLAGNYKKVTLIDIRYISPAVLDRFVEFDGSDVLFLYSSLVLNNSVGQFIK